MASVPTENIAAYELYLQSQTISQVYPEPPNPETEREQSIRIYRRALELDSTSADAWAAFADSYAKRSWERGWDLAWADVARRPLVLNPALAYAYAQLGDAYMTLGKTEKQRT